MTAMPDVIGKTRIFASLEKWLNAMNKAQLEALLHEFTVEGKSIKDFIADHIDDLDFWIKGGADDDQEHIEKHVFGDGDPDNHNGKDPGGAWWDPEGEGILTEGMARTLERMLFDTQAVPVPLQQPKQVTFWWLCPSVTSLRVVVTDNTREVTTLVITPPKGDHDDHFKKYKKRLKDRALPDIDTPVPPVYDKLEDSWVVTRVADAVIKGRRGSVYVDVAQHLVPITNGLTGVTVTRPFCEPY